MKEQNISGKISIKTERERKKIHENQKICKLNKINCTYSNLYQEVTFGTKKMWPYKTGDLLKEIQLI